MKASDANRGAVSQISKEIVEHLKRNPKAADTVEGIANWWLPKDGTRSPDDVQCALEKLVAQGRVERHLSPEGRCLYRKRKSA